MRSPYNASLVSEIKALPGRKWDGTNKVWSVPSRLRGEVEAIVRQYFQIEGEASTVEYETVRVVVRAKSSYKRSYLGNVTVDGHDIVNSLYGNVRRNDDAFEVLEEKGGFTRGDSHHAFEVEYALVLKARIIGVASSSCMRLLLKFAGHAERKCLLSLLLFKFQQAKRLVWLMGKSLSSRLEDLFSR